ncbi:hypothetical protein CVV43_01660 [Candidatus Saccharibacteria bacterium HGW-Saccharibacteria-1]|nr:MAG: hypothetical protein CVV43_01660 [Candidatus Saccharibacteria bacterium HGW-Saccharibacteria-1]
MKCSNQKMPRISVRLVIILSFAITTSMVFFLFGFNNQVTLFISVSLLFFSIILMCAKSWNRSFLLLLFTCAIGLFLLGRYTLHFINGDTTSQYVNNDSIIKTLRLIYISLYGVIIGSIIGLMSPNNSHSASISKRSKIVKNISWPLSILSGIVFLVYNLLLLESMRGQPYESLYIDSSRSIMPEMLTGISQLFIYVMCVFLATYPSKKKTNLVLMIYIMSQIPICIIGSRAPLISAIVFSLAYILLRKYRPISFSESKQWLKKKELIMIIIMTPIIMIAMSAVGNSRGNANMSNDNTSSNGLVDLIEKQGVTFRIVAFSIEREEEIPKPAYGSYIFSPVINNLAGYFLGSNKTISSQTLKSAERGVNSADALSYVVIGDRYLEGYGLGSSYIIDSYLDAGWIGVFAISFIIGLFLIKATNAFGKYWIINYIILIITTEIFMLPRGIVANVIMQLLYPKTIILLTLIFLLSMVISRNNKEKIIK